MHSGQPSQPCQHTHAGLPGIHNSRTAHKVRQGDTCWGAGSKRNNLGLGDAYCPAGDHRKLCDTVLILERAVVIVVASFRMARIRGNAKLVARHSKHSKRLGAARTTEGGGGRGACKHATQPWLAHKNTCTGQHPLLSLARYVVSSKNSSCSSSASGSGSSASLQRRLVNAAVCLAAMPGAVAMYKSCAPTCRAAHSVSQGSGGWSSMLAWCTDLHIQARLH